MLAEIFAIIATGVSIVEGVTRVLRNLQELDENRSDKTFAHAVETIQQRVTVVENELRKSEVDDYKLSQAYHDLVKALQEDKNYSSLIQIVPTDYGTWKIVRKRKNTILRDPQGEY